MACELARRLDRLVAKQLRGQTDNVQQAPSQHQAAAALAPGILRRMPVEIDIAKVANLARLALSPEELERYGSQLQDILEHAERVSALPTEGVAPTSHPLPMTNAFRPDEVRPSLDREEVLEQAPQRDGEYFRVPRILDES